MIKVQSKYDPSVEGNWRLTEKIYFSSGKRRWDRTGYSIGLNSHPTKYHYGGIGGVQPALLGATCLTVWSK